MRVDFNILGRVLTCLVFTTVAGRSMAAEIVKVGPENRQLLPQGKEVDAIDGDYLLRSDRIAAVIGGVADFRDANVNTQAVQGAVIDLSRLDLAGGNNDLLSAYYPMGHYLDAPEPTRVEVVKAQGDETVIRFTRSASRGMQGDPVDAETEYRLRDGEPFLRIITTYRNRGSKPANAAIYDKIRADTLFRIPAKGDSTSLVYDEPWHNAAYGVVRAGGASIRSYANPARITYNQEGGNRLDFPEILKDAAKPIGKALPVPSTIPAGGEVKVERFLIPGRHPADVQAVIAQVLGETVTSIPVQVTDPAGQPVAGAEVQATRGKTVLSEGRTDSEGRLTLIVKGEAPCDIEMTQRGRAKVTAQVSPKDAAAKELKLAAGPIAQAAFDVFDVTHGRTRGPVQVLLRGVDGTPDPNFGPDALPYQASNLCYSADGSFTVVLPPGNYEATFGRGPEFTREHRRFKAVLGETTPVPAEIRRAFDSPGWIIADIHNHTSVSNDSIADTRGRIVGIAAGGVEFAPATEHNQITSFTPHIEALHLTPFLASTGSIELSGRPGPGSLNHQNAFPLVVHKGAQGGGAPRTDRDPKVQIGRLFHLDNDSDKFVQQNHPDVAWLYFDKDRDGTIDGGFGTRPYTHAIEINRDIVRLLGGLESHKANSGRGLRWLQMLNQGDRIYGTANSDAHVTKNNNGTIFTYIKSSTDDPSRLDPQELAKAAKTGQMVMSNGPFLDVTVDGVLPGGDVRGQGTKHLTTKVWCAPWIDVDRVQVLVNGQPDPALNFTRASRSDGFHDKSEALRFDLKIPVDLKEDAHIIVIATGEKSKLGAAAGNYAAQAPTAVTNPIFVDTKGDGFTPNKNTLGISLLAAPGGNEAGDGQD